LVHDSEVSVRGLLALLLLGFWCYNISWWEHMAEETCSPHGGQEAKRQRKSQGPTIHIQGYTPNDLTSSH
jgi:hypothetical protein